MTIARFLMVALLVVPVSAQAPAGFGLWRAADLKQHDAALAKKIGPDHSARETLADYGDHRFRFINRDADGAPEQHDQIVDVVFVQSGEGTLVLGGRMVGSKGTGEKGESLGTDIQGGQSFPVAAGDVIHIPAKIPHRYLVPKGKHISYVLFKLPAK
jgi:mannose-6-phosphate isomerase-like protein (cupin superfamily)